MQSDNGPDGSEQGEGKRHLPPPFVVPAGGRPRAVPAAAVPSPPLTLGAPRRAEEDATGSSSTTSDEPLVLEQELTGIDSVSDLSGGRSSDTTAGSWLADLDLDSMVPAAVREDSVSGDSEKEPVGAEEDDQSDGLLWGAPRDRGTAPSPPMVEPDEEEAEDVEPATRPGSDVEDSADDGDADSDVPTDIVDHVEDISLPEARFQRAADDFASAELGGAESAPIGDFVETTGEVDLEESEESLSDARAMAWLFDDDDPDDAAVERDDVEDPSSIQDRPQSASPLESPEPAEVVEEDSRQATPAAQSAESAEDKDLAADVAARLETIARSLRAGGVGGAVPDIGRDPLGAMLTGYLAGLRERSSDERDG